MSSATISPNNDDGIGSWGIFGSGSTPIYPAIQQLVTDGSATSDYIAGPFNAGSYYVRFQSTPSDVGTITAATLKAIAQYSTSKGDNKSFNARLYQSDKSTALTSSVNTAVSGTFSTYTINFTLTGATDKTTWDSLRLLLTPQSGSSSGSIFIAAAQLDLTYTAAASGSLFTMSFLKGLAPCGPKNFNRLERCIPSLWIPRRPQILVPAMVVTA